jgi:hypothetical protein
MYWWVYGEAIEAKFKKIRADSEAGDTGFEARLPLP